MQINGLKKHEITQSLYVQTDFNNLVPEYHEVNFQVNDYIDFKKHVLDEISLLKESLKSSSDLNVNSESFAISCLQNHIKSLQSELKDKQRIIDALLGEKKQESNKNHEQKKSTEATNKTINDSKFSKKL